MTSLRSSRNGQQAPLGINSIGTIAITILVAVVIIGLGGTILEKIQDTQADDSVTNLNQSLTWSGNNTEMPFTEGRVSTSTVILYNNGTLIAQGGGSGLDGTANYTISAGGITFINDSEHFNGTGDDGGETGNILTQLDTDTFNVTYSYNIGSQARNSTEFGLTGMVTFSEFVPTIAIVAAAAIVIGIILLMFGRRKEDQV